MITYLLTYNTSVWHRQADGFIIAKAVFITVTLLLLAEGTQLTKPGWSKLHTHSTPN